MNNFKDIMLSITDKYDKVGKNASKVVDEEKEASIYKPLNDTQENAELFQYILGKKSKNWQLGTAYEGAYDIPVFVNDGYYVFRYDKHIKGNNEWVIKKENSFLVRITKLDINTFKIKMSDTTLSCLNLNDELQDIIRTNLVQKKFCYFTLDFKNTLEIIDEIFVKGSTRRNNIV